MTERRFRDGCAPSHSRAGTTQGTNHSPTKKCQHLAIGIPGPQVQCNGLFQKTVRESKAKCLVTLFLEGGEEGPVWGKSELLVHGSPAQASCL